MADVPGDAEYNLTRAVVAYQLALRIERAVEAAVRDGEVTKDIGGPLGEYSEGFLGSVNLAGNVGLAGAFLGIAEAGMATVGAAFGEETVTTCVSSPSRSPPVVPVPL